MSATGGAANESEVPVIRDRTTVLVADGEQLFARALSAALEHHPDLAVVEECPTTGGQVLRATLAHRPNVLLLDLWIPGTTAPAVTRMLSVWAPKVEVLMLTWLPPRRHAGEALRSGAMGLLSKSDDIDRLVAAVLHLRRPEHAQHGAELAARRETLRAQDPDAEQRWAALCQLTPREVEVLQHLSQGLPARNVAENLSISAATVKHHITKILAKTGARTQVEAVNLARHEGLVREIGPPYTPPDLSEE